MFFERFFSGHNRRGVITIHDDAGRAVESISKTELQSKVMACEVSPGADGIVPMPAKLSLEFIVTLLAHMMRGHVPIVEASTRSRAGGRVELPEGGVPGDAVYAQRSSGTTGTPKLLPVTGAELVRNIDFIAGHVLPDGTGIATSWLPMYHDMGLVGMLFTPLLYDVDLNLLSVRSFLRRPALWFEICAGTGSTITYAPPRMWRMAAERYEDESGALSKLHVAGVGGDTIYANDIAAAQGALGRHGMAESAWLASYGMAEAVLAIGFRHFPNGLQAHLGSGRVLLPSMDIAPDSRNVRVDPTGRIELASDLVIGSCRAISGHAGADYLTSDLGFISGRDLYVTGRDGDFLKVNGRKVFFSDIEDMIRAMGCPEGGIFVCRREEDHDASLRAYVPKKHETFFSQEAVRRVRQALFFDIGIKVAFHVVENNFISYTTSGKIRRKETVDRLFDKEII